MNQKELLLSGAWAKASFLLLQAISPLAIISNTEFYIQMLFFLLLSLEQQYMKSFQEGEHLLWGD